MQDIIPTISDKREGATKLVILFHAYSLKPESLNAVATTIRESPGFDDADIVRPRLPLGHVSSANMNRLARQVLHMIDRLYQERPYEAIYLIGHSAGALLARKVYVAAWGETPDAPFEPELRGEVERSWVRNVRRIVLLAGMNRGWQISHHLSIPKAITLTVGTWVGQVWEFVSGKKLVIFQIRRGAPFLTQLRLQWLAMRKKLNRNKQHDLKFEGVITVQLLGSIDDFVAPDDNIDLVAGSDFVYLDVGFSGHASVIAMDDALHGSERATQFRKALTLNKRALDDQSVQVSDYRPRHIDDKVTDVIFVVHGIRDAGFWTQKIARRVAEISKAMGGDRKFGMVTSSYGYFPMGPFLMPGKRREKVEWLMDQYAEAVACFPNAEEFSCVGHSNGTYLIAKALEEYPSCRFKRIVFAGSVVRSNYNWSRLISLSGHARVQAVANYVSTRDWVVAWFPKLFQWLGVQDLGSAGHDGFDEDRNGKVKDERFIKGGHGAALDERNWDAIARFVLTGKSEDPPAELQATHQVWWVKLFGYCPLVVWAGLACLLFLGGQWIYRHSPGPSVRTAGVILYVLAVLKILTKF